ncbi:prepilin peptidase [Chloroflexia bacterium SDU3-3]|nr:prepilin peptidase [Chloroflexia bacterium SDU3-3]
MLVTAVLIAILGLAMGMLLNILVVRIPREKHMGGWPRCTRCGKPLEFWQALPLVGWLAQRGRARCCGKRLHWVHPLVDALSMLSLVVFYLHYDLSARFFFLAFVAAVLLLTAAIDWLHRSIYTLFILVPALLAVVVSAWVPGLGVVNSVVGALFAGFAFVLLFMLARILFPGKAAPFGLGDVYLAIFIGATVGIVNLMPALFYGILAAGIYSAGIILMRRAGRPNMPEYIAYGSFLCLGTLAFLMVQAMI